MSAKKGLLGQRVRQGSNFIYDPKRERANLDEDDDNDNQHPTIFTDSTSMLTLHIHFWALDTAYSYTS